MTKVKKLKSGNKKSSVLRSFSTRHIGLQKESESEMLKFKNFGRKSLTELQEKLGELNLSFGMDISQYLDA